MARAKRTRRLTSAQKAIGLAAIVALVLGLHQLSRWGETHAFMVNQTESLPNWAFFVDGGRFPERGDYVVFDPGKDELTVAYFGHGQAFTKIATGIPGDTITRSGRDVLVNGEVVARTKAKTKKGEPLAVGPIGTVPEDCVFATTPIT